MSTEITRQHLAGLQLAARLFTERGYDGDTLEQHILGDLIARASEASVAAPAETPEQRFEHYLQTAIDNAPEPLRRLGEHLSRILDEDEWATAERLLNGAMLAAPAVQPVEQQAADSGRAGREQDEREAVALQRLLFAHHRATRPADAGLFGWAAAVLTQQAEQKPVYVECRECAGCGHIGINDSLETNSACSRCAWIGPSPAEDKCPGCAADNVMSAACPKCGCIYRLLTDAEVTAPPAAQDVAPLLEALEAIAVDDWECQAYATDSDVSAEKGQLISRIKRTARAALAAHRAQQGGE